MFNVVNSFTLQAYVSPADSFFHLALTLEDLRSVKSAVQERPLDRRDLAAPAVAQIVVHISDSCSHLEEIRMLAPIGLRNVFTFESNLTVDMSQIGGDDA